MAEDQGDIAVDIDHVTKRYGDFTALADVSLAIRSNEFFTLLGPSGCGKTTLLRCIAGFEDITLGAIRLYGDNIVDLPPNKRPVNTVFQQYALFPHMDVTRNVMFGLLRLGQSEAAARKRAGEVLDLVQLTQFADRLPAQLSGGQQQRVALARALAPNPKVLLLDEPLSALDLKLRQAVRLELQQIQQETGITFIFVTHDQEEALTMSDRIAVISDGRLQQIGTARDIYEEPDNKFVADFIGETNLIDVTVAGIDNGQATCTLPGGNHFTCPAAQGAHSGRGHLSVRPERVSLSDPAQGLLTGTVSRLIYLGTDMHVDITLTDGEVVTARVQNSAGTRIPAMGETIGLNFEAGAARLLID
ncbi:ABC transporter ATP-binding protein [Marimonas arenosa]|uniref:ABC transporter ATP-binding protein n=1 Tax=Marimonas arenosa TaxID=1795305 RepID=A0AAE3WE35_9RHOB|nr:ABC transporter ATP-binding protein [Marimonas arenosa]MDQ2090818.1 ABC transporter ATP-binding protein [Marimonas arenosa]